MLEIRCNELFDYLHYGNSKEEFSSDIGFSELDRKLAEIANIC